MRLAALIVGTALVGIAAGPEERPTPADLVLTLAGPSTVELHSTAPFLISVRNEIAAADVQPRVTVRLAAGMSYVEPAGATVPCSGRTRTVVCQVPKLPVTFTFPVVARLQARAAIEAVAEADVQEVRPDDNTDRAAVGVYSLALRRLRTTPARPKAGGRFVAAATLVRTDTGVAVRPRSASCLASIGRNLVGSGQPLRGRLTVRGGRISCAWPIPARPRGRFFRGVFFDRRSSGYQPKLSFWRQIS